MIEGKTSLSLHMSQDRRLTDHELEIPNPHTEGPKVMVSCVGIGTVTGSIFLIVLLFVAGDMDKVVNSSAGPLLQILIHSTQNRAGGVCLLMYVLRGWYRWHGLGLMEQATTCLPCICDNECHDNEQSHDLCFCQVRPLVELTRAMLRVRDGGLPASNFLSVIHPSLRLPLNALLLTTVTVILFGLIFIGSSR